MFKSPTCTRYDIDLAEYLAKLAEISLTDLGNVMFSSEASADKPVEEFMYSDFKEFHIAGYKLGIENYDFILLMITDVLKEGTYLLFLGDEDTISQAYNVTPTENEVFLPKVMSRKKQIVPRLSELWG